MSVRCPNGHASEAEDYCDTCGAPIDASAQRAAGAPPEGAVPEEGEAAAGTAEQPAAPAPGAPAEPGGAAGPAGTTEAAGPAATAQPTEPVCPNCGTRNRDGALFCEACGYDFTTGALPRSAPGAGAGAGAGAAATGSEGASAPQAEPVEWVAEVWVDPDWYRTQDAEDPCPSPGLPLIVPLRRRSVLVGRTSTSRNTHPEIELSSDPGVSRRHAQLTTDGTRWFVEDLDSSNGTFVGPASGPLPEQPIEVGPRTELGDDDRLYLGAWTRLVVRAATPDEAQTYA